MRFQSKYTNAVYIVRPTTRIFYPEMGTSQLKPGLAAKFEGRQRIFDSEKAAAYAGWSDDEREAVENHLLKHRDWGLGLYLAPGQTMPEGKVTSGLAKPEPISVRRCGQLEVTLDGDIAQCKEQAMLGSEFCSAHDPAAAQVSQSTVGGSGKVG